MLLVLLGPRGRTTNPDWLGGKGQRQQGYISHAEHQLMTCHDGRFEERVKYVTYSNGNILIRVTSS